MLNVTSLVESVPTLPVPVFVGPKSALKINAAWLGGGRFTSLHNIKTTSDMLGLAVADSCTHNSPIWIHLKISGS